MTDEEAAVLEAARKWLAAKEAALAADTMREDDRMSTEHAVDQAEYELTDAVYRWLGREPRLPSHRG